MKNISNAPKIITFLLVFFLICLGTSCKDKKSDYKGSYDGSNSCELITADDIRSVFNLNNTVEIEQTKKLKEVCYYKWQSSTQNSFHYSVRFTFSRWKQKSASEMNKTWESQNKSVYNDRNLQKVNGVGDKASWSDQVHGQLRVTEDGYFFYISIYVEPKNESHMKTQDLIEKTSALAKRVIEKM